jgi:hypothetical protein
MGNVTVFRLWYYLFYSNILTFYCDQIKLQIISWTTSKDKHNQVKNKTSQKHPPVIKDSKIWTFKWVNLST